MLAGSSIGIQVMRNQRNDYRPTIGIIMPMLSGFYMGEINATLRKLASEHEVNLIFIRSGDKRDFALNVSLAHIDALIVVLHSATHRLVEQAIKQDIPVFSMGASYNPLPVEQFYSDQTQGVAELYQWLTEQGHQKIGFCGDLNVNDIRERYNSYRNQITEPFDPELLFSVHNCYLAGGRDGAVLFQQRNQPCSAIICATDHNALGMIEQLTHLGFRVPEDIAVVGIDNIFAGKHTSPSLTTVDQQLEALTTHVFNRAVSRINGVAFSSQIYTQSQKLIRRSSCGNQAKDDAEATHSIRSAISQSTQTSTSAIFDNFYSQAKGGFNAILDAKSLYGSRLDWACLASSNNEDYCIESWAEAGMTQPTPIPKDSGLNDRIEEFPFLQGCPHYVATILPIATGQKNRWKLVAVIDRVSQQHKIIPQDTFNNYLDMLALFIERDELVSTSNQKEQKSQQLLQQLEVVSNSSNDGIWEWDLKTKQFRLNARMLSIIGDTSSKTTSVFGLRQLVELIHPEDLSSIEESIQAHLTDHHPFKVEFRLRKNSGRYIWVKASGSAVYEANGSPVRIIGSISDITEQMNSQEKIHRMAYYDALTGAANRRMIIENISQHIEQHPTYPRAVMMMDLNRFKMINDSFGHHIGDALLIHVAKELQNYLGENHQLARLGGDEFLFFCDVAEHESAIQLANDILRTIAKPMVCDNIEITAQGSIGIAMYPLDAKSAEDLIKRADMAMYQAKRQGNASPVCFNHQVEVALVDEVTIEHHLKRAISNDEIELNYQPLYNPTSNKFEGVEALARWHSPQLGYIPPTRFIEIAERSQLINDLGHYLLHKICDDIKASASLKEMKHISVNISAKQLIQENFASDVLSIINHHKLDARKFCFEVTETAAISDFSRCLLALEELKAAGAYLSLDDFGTGFSSLSLLQRLPVDEIKIDRSFVADIVNDDTQLNFVSTILLMGHQLGLRVTIEGVETQQHLDKLKQLDADLLQGYFFAKPLTLERLNEKIFTSQGTTTTS